HGELRHVLRELALELLRAGADAREVSRPACRADLRRSLREAAMMAVQARVTVQRECDVAARAAPRLAARAAVQRGRDAAPIEQQDRLASVLDESAELREQRRRQRIAGLAAQVDDAH